jgi:hypothetical protein
MNSAALDNYLIFALKLNDDYEAMYDFIMKHGKTKLKRGQVMSYIEGMRYHRLELEVLECLKCSDEVFIKAVPKSLFDA